MYIFCNVRAKKSYNGLLIHVLIITGTKGWIFVNIYNAPPPKKKLEKF